MRSVVPTSFPPGRPVALLLLVTALLLPSCGGKSKNEMTSPQGAAVPPPRMDAGGGCPSVAGEYHGMYKTSCTSTGWVWPIVEQQGCRVKLKIPLLGIAEGTLNGETAAFTMTFQKPCSGAAQGAMSFSGKRVTGTFNGASTGENAQCCAPLTGSFDFEYRGAAP